MEMNENKKRRTMILYVIVGILVIVLLNTIVAPNIAQPKVTSVSYTDLMTMVNDKQVKEFNYNVSTGEMTFSAEVDGQLQYFTTTYWPGDDSLLPNLYNSGATASTQVVTSSGGATMLIYLLTLFLPILIFVGFGWWMNRKLKKQLGDDNPSMSFGGFGQGLGRSGAKIVAEKETGVTFEDVAGQDEAKEALTEIVDFLDKPERYEEIGAKLPRGALLVGPPGTGKTLLAKAVAGEAHVPFFSISGSEFVEMFVGRGAAKVRDLFKQAKEKAPCIVFIDEIDTIGKRRDTAGFTSNDEREQTLNQLLTEMDGFDNHKGIVVLGATNRPETLDPALLRPGRFDRRVPVELPDLNGRTAILKLHAKNVKMAGPIDFGVIARSTRAPRAPTWRTSSTRRRCARCARAARASFRRTCRSRSRWSSPASSARAWCSPTRRSASSRTTRSATPSSPPSRRDPRRSPRSPSCRAPRARWATPCRWTRTRSS